MKVSTPANRKTFVLNGSLHQCDIVPLVEIQSRDIRHRDVVRIAVDPLDRIARTNLALLHNREIPTVPLAVQEASDHILTAKLEAQLIARQARLRRLQQRGPNAEPIADVHGIFK